MTHSFPTRRSSDLRDANHATRGTEASVHPKVARNHQKVLAFTVSWGIPHCNLFQSETTMTPKKYAAGFAAIACLLTSTRSEEHTSELQSLMRISYAVFCLKKKTTTQRHHTHTHIT